MSTESLYGELAHLYDRIYHFKQYEAEALKVREILNANGVADGSSVLEAACGTGNHLVHLRKWFDVSGFDMSPAMLRIAMPKLPGVPLFEADMSEFKVPRPFDAVLCLFSSIAYMEDSGRLETVAARFAEAVRPGGVCLVEPFVSPDKFIDGSSSVQTYTGDDLKCVRANVSYRVGNRAPIKFHWLVMPAGCREITHFTEEHVLTLFSDQELRTAFENAGFDVTIGGPELMQSRNLLVGVRKAAGCYPGKR